MAPLTLCLLVAWGSYMTPSPFLVISTSCAFKLNPAQRALPTQVEAFWDLGLPPSLGGGRDGDATTASWFTPLVNITSGW